MFKNKKQNTLKVPNSQVINIIGEDSIIEGKLISKGAMRIDGIIKGDIEAEGKLFLSPSSKVYGDIQCNEAEICGVVEGNINAKELVSVSDTAKVKGDIYYSQIQISPGAQLESKLLQVKGKSESISTEKSDTVSGKNSKSA